MHERIFCMLVKVRIRPAEREPAVSEDQLLEGESAAQG